MNYSQTTHWCNAIISIHRNIKRFYCRYSVVPLTPNIIPLPGKKRTTSIRRTPTTQKGIPWFRRLPNVTLRDPRDPGDPGIPEDERLCRNPRDEGQPHCPCVTTRDYLYGPRDVLKRRTKAPIEVGVGNFHLKYNIYIKKRIRSN